MSTPPAHGDIVRRPMESLRMAKAHEAWQREQAEYEARTTPVERAARQLMDRITEQGQAIAVQVKELRELVAEAQEKHVHLTLGYPSWTACLTAEFKKKPLRGLSAADRRELVAVLTDEGMSQRAIATVVGVNQATVSRDRASRDAYESRDDVAPSTVLAEGVTPMTVRAVTTAARTTGLDGKSYPAATPRPERRVPLPRSYAGACYDLERALGRLARLHADDRFLGHRPELTKGRAIGMDRSMVPLRAILQDLTGAGDICTSCGGRIVPDRFANTTCSKCSDGGAGR